MRVLIVTPLIPPEPGGPSYYSVALKEALERAGQEVSLIAFREVRRYPSGIRHLIFLYKVLLKARTVDTLIILDTVSVALPAVLAGWLLNRRTIIRTGGDFVWEHYIERTKEKILLSEFYKGKRKLSFKERLLVWLQKRIIFRFVDTLVFSTEWQRNIWMKHYALNAKHTAVIENSYPKKVLVAEGGDTFLCAWRSTGFKNIDTLEAAYERAQKECHGIELEVLRNIPREELHERMRTARALVVPSLSEVSPNMAMEALAMGLPVLLTKDCGIKERLGGAVTWIDPLSPDDIAKHLCACLDSEVYQQARARTVVHTYVHTYDDIAREFIEVCKATVCI